uniref:Uncharacterized protein n=1 Tax=Amphimedon queenslandica TaxID=400682 RepID=A0A1X7SQN3_AMPQE
MASYPFPFNSYIYGWREGGGRDEGSEGGGRIEGWGGGGGSVGGEGGGLEGGGALGGRPDDIKKLSGGRGCWEAEVIPVEEEVAREFNLVEISVRDRQMEASSSLTNMNCCERSSTDL